MYRDARSARPPRRRARLTGSVRGRSAGGDSVRPVVLTESPDPTVGTGPLSVRAPCSQPPGLPGTVAAARCKALSSSYSRETALGTLVLGVARGPHAAGISRQTAGESSLPP